MGSGDGIPNTFYLGLLSWELDPQANVKLNPSPVHDGLTLVWSMSAQLHCVGSIFVISLKQCGDFEFKKCQFCCNCIL